MAAKTTSTAFLEHIKEGPHHEFFLPPRSRRSSSRRSSGGSDSSRTSALSCSSTSSTDSGTSTNGIVKGLTILSVCLMYAFALFFIASLTTAFSYVFGFGHKDSKRVVRRAVTCKSTQQHSTRITSMKMPISQQG